MTTDSDRLYQTICAYPERDELRLAFADAIENSDPEWAAYIRRVLAGGDCRDRSRDLEARIKAPLARFDIVARFVERGFIDRINIRAAEFIRYGHEIVNLAPIYGAKIVDCDLADVPLLLASPGLARIREIEFGLPPGTQRYGEEEFRAIVSAPNLANLVRLTLFIDSARPGLLDEMLASSTCRQMMSWSFADLRVGDRTSTEWVTRGWYDYDITTFHPMPPEDREYEKTWGYIPALHAVNWRATTLDVMRGKAPAFAPGTPVTEAMYALPEPLEVVTGISP